MPKSLPPLLVCWLKMQRSMVVKSPAFQDTSNCSQPPSAMNSGPIRLPLMVNCKTALTVLSGLVSTLRAHALKV